MGTELTSFAQPRGRNHYYWLTALLAARGLQTVTCRFIALTTFLLGLLPLCLTLAGAPPQLPWPIALIVTLGCVLVAWIWGRPHWPSRQLSEASSLLGTACIAVFCLFQPHPMVGLLGTVAFITQTVFVCFFHTVRRLALMWTVAAATVIPLALRLTPVEPTVAFAAVVLIAFVNGFAAFGCAMVVRLIGDDVGYADIEPVTGLLNRAGFEEKVAGLIGARSRSDDRYLMIAVLNLDAHSLTLSLLGEHGANRVRVAAAQQLRTTARSDAVIGHVVDAEFLLGDVFTDPDPSPLIERVRGAVGAPPARATLSVGVVSTPLEPLAGHSAPDVLDELLTIAATAMYDARRAGGDQVRYIRDPDLTSLDGRRDDLTDTG